jgi:hypothetical protein
MIYSRQPKPCLYCGHVMMVPPCYMERKRFCSRSCLSKFYAPQKLKPNTKPTSTSWKKGDNMGNAHPRWVAPIIKICEFCETEFSRKPWQLNARGNKGRFCSAKCRGLYKAKYESGENSPDYVGGERTYRGRNWKQIRLITVEAQEGRCALCQRYVGKSLPVHHIKPFREFESADDANQPHNLIGMCQSCHMKTEPRPYRRDQKDSVAVA